MEDSLDANNNVEENVEENVKLEQALEHETVEGLLGKPAWRHETLTEARFTTLAQFECALADWGRVIQQHLTEHDFNLFGDYVQFYRDYSIAIANTKKQNPLDFYRDYKAKINPNLMNCAGLSLTLLNSLKESDPEFGSYFALVSSEENNQMSTELGQSYELESENVVKRHVLICIKLILCDRRGYVLMDSGYNVVNPIVVMQDEEYPHTGWFTQWRRARIEQRNYKYVNDRFIKYDLRSTNLLTGALEPAPLVHLIFVEREYLSHETVTQKRSLLINIKFWVIRSAQGPVAALCSLIDRRNLTILYKEKEKDFVKEQFSIDQLDSEKVHLALRKVAECSVAQSANHQSLINDDDDDEIENKFQLYLQILQEFRKSLKDEQFSRDIVTLDEWILGKKQKISTDSAL